MLSDKQQVHGYGRGDQAAGHQVGGQQPDDSAAGAADVAVHVRWL